MGARRSTSSGNGCGNAGAGEDVVTRSVYDCPLRYTAKAQDGRGISATNWLRVVATVGAILHVIFALQETVGWGPKFVRRAAKAWIDPQEDAKVIDSHVAWARRLAFNMGAYNLVLAIGLAWVAVAGAPVAGTLGIFLAVSLLVAAPAAGVTQVYPALVAKACSGWHCWRHLLGSEAAGQLPSRSGAQRSVDRQKAPGSRQRFSEPGPSLKTLILQPLPS
jgi:uncharacterized membrane protein